jgi:type III restriction enzyme
VFSGFEKCLYPLQKFDAEPERRFAEVLENDRLVVKWVKPARDQFDIELPDGGKYHPDFIVETLDGCWVIEVKAANEVESREVQEKARAAREWCQHATEGRKQGGKTWKYALIRHDRVATSSTFAGLTTGGFER